MLKYIHLSGQTYTGTPKYPIQTKTFSLATEWESGEANRARVTSADPGTGGGNEQGLVGELTTHRHFPRYPNLLGCPAGHYVQPTPPDHENQVK